MINCNGIMSDHTLPVQVGEFLNMRTAGKIVSDQLRAVFLHRICTGYGYRNFYAFDEGFHIEIVFEVVGINVRIVERVVASQLNRTNASVNEKSKKMFQSKNDKTLSHTYLGRNNIGMMLHVSVSFSAP